MSWAHGLFSTDSKIQLNAYVAEHYPGLTPAMAHKHSHFHRLGWAMFGLIVCVPPWSDDGQVYEWMERWRDLFRRGLV